MGSPAKNSAVRTRHFTANINGELADAVTQLARDRQITCKEIVTRAFVLLLDELCEHVPEIARRESEREFSESTICSPSSFARERKLIQSHYAFLVRRPPQAVLASMWRDVPRPDAHASATESGAIKSYFVLREELFRLRKSGENSS